MTPESYFNSTEGSRIEAVQRHMFADIYHQVPDSVESDVTEGHLLRFIEKVYNARKRDPAERAELTHLFQAAQYITESNGLEPSTACHEFFSGELLATELLSRVTGNRRGAGMLAYEGIRHSADGMSLVAPHLIQQSIQVADFPLEYEDLLTRIMLERQKRHLHPLEEEGVSMADPVPFMMGYHYILNEAYHSGVLDTRQPASTLRPHDPQRVVENRFFAKPEQETLLHASNIPTAAFLHILLDNTFEKSDYEPIDDVIDTILAQYRQIKAAFVAETKRFGGTRNEDSQYLEGDAKEKLNAFVTQAHLFSAGELIKTKGALFYMETNDAEDEDIEARLKNDYELRDFFDDHYELRGEFSEMDVIDMPPEIHLQHRINGEYVDPNDPTLQRPVPALRLKNPSIIERDDDNNVTGFVRLNEKNIVLPLMYRKVEFARFVSSLEDVPSSEF